MTTEKEKIYEEDLYLPVKEMFEQNGFTVRSEVKSCDITAVKDERIIIIELKLGLTTDLLLQAVKRQRLADEVYVAIPKPKKLMFTKKWDDILYLLRRLELGLIVVTTIKQVSNAAILLEPSPFDRSKSKALSGKKRTSLLNEIKGRSSDGNTGGSRGKKLLTAYRETALHIATCLEKFGSLSPADLKKHGTDQQKTQSILTKNYYGWYNKEGRGVYSISDSGKDALEKYKETADFYRKIYDKN